MMPPNERGESAVFDRAADMLRTAGVPYFGHGQMFEFTGYRWRIGRGVWWVIGEPDPEAIPEPRMIGYPVVLDLRLEPHVLLLEAVPTPP